jgi:hypothetical protein
MISRLIPFILMLFFLSILSCNTSRYKEAEPNNTFATANTIEPGRTYSGTIENDRDIDCFSLNVDRERIIKIELTGIKGVNHAFSIFRMNGDTGILLKLVDDNRKSSPENFANLYVSPGRYIISVHHGERDDKKGNPDTAYNLKITEYDVSAEEREPNDRNRPNTIQPGYPLTGYFSPGRDRYNDSAQDAFREEDWYSFDITADESNPVTVTLDLTGVGGVDSVLELYDRQFNLIAQSDASSHGAGESITDFGIKSAGTYYAVVGAKNFQYNNSERYRLSLTVNSHSSDNELEPNNTFDEANTIQGKEIRGKFNSARDVDYFITGTDAAGKYLRIDLVNDESSDSTLAVYNKFRKKLFEINNTGPGGTEVLPALYIKDSMYIAVNSNSDSGGSYTLIFTEINSFNQIEIEPNNKKEDANPIKNIIKGYTTCAGDIDYYIVTNDSKKNYRIEFRAPANGSVKLSTTDQSGYIIKSQDVGNGSAVTINEIFEKRGYIIVETVVLDLENSYDLIIEDVR